jgi:DUF4097 and DUF4098 domain-containing protein YvlB
MSSFQKVIKYCAVAFAILLAVGIITGIARAALSVVSLVSGDLIYRYDRHDLQDTDVVNESEDFTGVRSLDIDIASGNLTITQGEGFRVEADDVTEDFEMKVTGKGTLILREKNKNFNFLWFHYNTNKKFNSNITLYLPADCQLNDVAVDTGAGKIRMDSFQADKLVVNAGAGNIEGDSITANEAILDGGAGSVSFTNVNFRNMDIDCGVGNVRIGGILLGKNTIDCGIGNVDLEIDAREEDYDLDIQSGLGKVRLNGKRISKDYRKDNDASSYIEIDGGIGDVDINFTR